MLGLASTKSIVSIHAPAQGGEMLTSRAKVGRIPETAKRHRGKCCGKCNSCSSAPLATIRENRIVAKPKRVIKDYLMTAYLPCLPTKLQSLPTKLPSYQAYLPSLTL